MAGHIKIDSGAIYSKLKRHAQDIISEYVGPNIIGKVDDKINEVIDKFVLEVQEKIIKPKVPKKSGKLRNSIRVVHVHGTPKNIVIRLYAGYPTANTVPYAPHIEEGTATHTIKASKTIHFKGYQKLRSPPKYARGRRKYSSTAVADVFISGRGGKGGIVKVKGIKAAHYMRTGAQFILRNLPGVIKRGIGTIRLSDMDAKTVGRWNTAGRPRAATNYKFKD